MLLTFNSQIRQIRQKQTQTKVAFVSLTSGALFQQIEAGIGSELALNNPRKSILSYDFITGQGNAKTLEQSIHNRLTNSNYDVIFSLGMTTTNLLAEWNTQTKNSTPIVFGGVSTTEVEKLKKEPTSHNIFTGIYGAPRDYKEQIEELLLIKPSIKKIAIICDACCFLNTEMKSAEDAIEKRNLSLIKISAHDTSDLNLLYQKLIGVDVVLLFRDSAILEKINILGRICDARNILLFASDAESVKHGAGLAFGDFDHLVGVQMAQKAIPILIDRARSNEIVISEVNWNNKFFINPTTIHKQSSSLNFEASSTKKVILM